MKYQVHTTNDNLRIELEGTLTFDCHNEFKLLLQAINNAQSDIEISLKGLSNMDSAGAGMLRLAKEGAQQTGKALTITDVPEPLEPLITLLK